MSNNTSLKFNKSDLIELLEAYRAKVITQYEERLKAHPGKLKEWEDTWLKKLKDAYKAFKPNLDQLSKLEYHRGGDYHCASVPLIMEVPEGLELLTYPPREPQFPQREIDEIDKEIRILDLSVTDVVVVKSTSYDLYSRIM